MPSNSLTLLAIDDVADATALLNGTGRSIIEDLASVLHAAVIERVSQLGWEIVSYSEYRDWARQLMVGANSWLILDPLFPAHCLGGRASILRATRSFRDGYSGIHPNNCTLTGEEMVSESVGVQDDVASAGSTLRIALRLIQSSGASVSQIVLCASSAHARTRLHSREVGGEWSVFKAGDCRTIHLRDAYPCLPFAGRGNRDRPFLHTQGGPVETRVPVSAKPQGMWSEVLRDVQVNNAMRHFTTAFVQRFGEFLGREARIADLPALGRHLALSIPAHLKVTENCPLHNVLL